MRILQLNKFHYRRGGAETVYFAEAELLRRAGHEVVPFSMRDPRNEPTPYERYFVSNVDLRETAGGLAGRAGAALRILYSREAERGLTRLLRKVRPDVAHLHNVYHQLSPSVFRALGRAGVPAVMTLHDYKLICPAYTLYTEGAPCERCQGGRFYEAVRHRCVKGSRAASALCATEAYLHGRLQLDRDVVKFYIAPSEFLLRKVVQFGTEPRRLVHIPNFITPGPEPAPGTGVPYVLYAGRIEQVKGVGTLLRAVEAGALAGGVELRIAGDGEARARYEGWCRERGLAGVRFLGHLPPAALRAELEGSRFVVAPSEWHENAPLSVLEAAERGKAVVTTALGGLPELVVHGETGVIVPAGDSVALRDAVRDLLARPEATRDMGRKARALVLERHSPEVHLQQLERVYARALGQPGDD